MMHHSVEEAVVGVVHTLEVVRTPYFFWSSDFRKLEPVTLVEQVEDGHHLFIFERILSQKKLEFLIVVGATPFLLQWSFSRQLNCHHFFPFRFGRLGCITPLGV